jgi:hypothetical protein
VEAQLRENEKKKFLIKEDQAVPYENPQKMPVAVRSTSKACSLSIAGIAGLNPAEGTDVQLSFVWCALFRLPSL